MAGADSIIDRDEIARARALLAPPVQGASVWAPLGAAAFLALSSLAFATAMIIAPAVTSEHVAPERGAR